jgi:N-ethylmaleimide reductase
LEPTNPTEEPLVTELLFSPYRLGRIELRNRIVMAPMTRNRSIGNVPGEPVATYYGQRAGAGLIVSEGVSPSPDGLGYPRIPGVFSSDQIAGWRRVAEAVHAHGGRIFMQLMHTGRIGHSENLPAGAELLAPSAVAAAGEIWTDAKGLQPHPRPRAMTVEEIVATIDLFAKGAANAVEAGLDGVEIHGANGYLVDQFLNPKANRREDEWGGDPSGRNRFAVEVARGAAKAIGADRVGIRLSPYGVFNDLSSFDGLEGQYAALARELAAIGIAYVHVVDHSAMGAPKPEESTVTAIREAFGGTIVLSGGYDRARAEADLTSGRGQLVAFGRPFISNPDLPERLRSGAVLAAPDPATFYTPGAAGYVDYPVVGETKG